MITITQKDNLGCGVACTAFVLGKTYDEIKKHFTQSAKGYLCKEIVAVFKKYGIDYRFKYLTSKLKRKIYGDGTVVFIKRNKKYPFGHYLARSGNFWMDPWINFQNDKNINNARSGFRKRLPGNPIYGIFKIFIFNKSIGGNRVANN